MAIGLGVSNEIPGLLLGSNPAPPPVFRILAENGDFLISEIDNKFMIVE
jgi:hypothetical protein|tara:strand:+ start:1337 stop:1483 length:147 start_codon:yes stop_codon:yes gene_type:complete